MSKTSFEYPLAAALPWLAAFVIGAAAHVSVVREMPVTADAERPAQRVGPLIDVDIDVKMVPTATPPSPPPSSPPPSGVGSGGAVFTIDAECSESLDTPLREAGLFAVRQQDATHVEVERGFIEDLVARTHQLDVRIVPAVRGGKTTGLKLFGVRQCSPLRLLGLRNGDQLQTINGRSLAGGSPTVEPYRPLQEEESEIIRLGLERHGQPMTIVYRVVETTRS